MRREPARYDDMHPTNTFEWSLISGLQKEVANIFIEESLLEYIHTLIQSNA